MWFVDIVVDLPWFAATKGKLGLPKSRATQSIPDHDMTNTFLLYGDHLVIRHLRILLHTDSREQADAVVGANVHRWVNLLEVSSGLIASKTATTASLGRDTSEMIILMGEGDEESDACHIEPHHNPPVPINYDAAANMMAAWGPDFRVHLFYLGSGLIDQSQKMMVAAMQMADMKV